jgi:hypothetical protein
MLYLLCMSRGGCGVSLHSASGGDWTAPDRRNIVLAVDWDNFVTSCAGRGLGVQPEALSELAREIGRPIWKIVFVDTRTISDEDRGSFFRYGFTIVDCPRLGAGRSTMGKDMVDAKMIEVMNFLAEHVKFEVLLLASADRDFLLSIQMIRDTGRKVQIIVPTTEDHPELSGLSDGAVVYDRHFYGKDSVLTRVVSLFEQRNFQTTDQTLLRELVRLREIVAVLLQDIEVNTRQFGFHALQRKVTRCLAINDNEARILVSFLVTHGVLERQPIEVDDGSRSSAICYRVREDHPFVGLNLHVLKEMAGLFFQ